MSSMENHSSLGINHLEATPPLMTLPQKTQAPLKIEFDRYYFRKDEIIPPSLDLRGAIVIEEDVKHTGWLHKIMYIVQIIHQFLSKLFGWVKKPINPNLCHGSIVMDRVTDSKNIFIGDHSLLENGVKTTTMNWHDQKNITNLIIYVPKNPELKELILKHAKQTCYEETGKYGHTDTKRTSRFSTKDLLMCSFHRPLKKPTKEMQKRTARAVADLLMGNQFLDQKGKKPRSFFCIPYMTSVLTGSNLIQSLQPGEKELLLERKDGTKRTRDEVAKLIYLSIRDRHDTNSLSRAYWGNPINQIDTRYLGTGYLSNYFDQVSTEKTHESKTVEVPTKLNMAANDRESIEIGDNVTPATV